MRAHTHMMYYVGAHGIAYMLKSEGSFVEPVLSAFLCTLEIEVQLLDLCDKCLCLPNHLSCSGEGI